MAIAAIVRLSLFIDGPLGNYFRVSSLEVRTLVQGLRAIINATCPTFSGKKLAIFHLFHHHNLYSVEK
jgi:hypothetical protein